MRKSDAASIAARKTSGSGNRGNAPLELVCLALLLAVLALGLRIASIW
jgi:hypothetical protein